MMDPDYIELPPLDEWEYMPEVMLRLGPVRPGSENYRATDWPEIGPFAQYEMLDREDRGLLFEMCKHYAETLFLSRNPLSIEPLSQEMESDD